MMTIYTTLLAVSLSLGFWAGSRARSRTQLVNLSRSRTNLPTAVRPAALLQSRTSNISNPETGNESDGISSGLIVNDNTTSLRVNAADDCKMVLVVRTDLGMTCGKIAAQCSHATLACYKTLRAENPALLRQWERTGQAKVALRCEHEEELLLLEAQAQSLKLCARSIQDAGRTQIAAGSRTVLGIIGPTRLIDQITGELRLL